MSGKKIKCKRCRCWRTEQDFIRRHKKWKICNMCSEWSKKSNVSKNVAKQTTAKTDHQSEMKTDTEPIITLVDLWPDIKDSSNSEQLKMISK